MIDVVEAHDAAALHDLLSLQTLACTTGQGAGGPPKCAAGEADGTEVSVFEFATCEFEWRREADGGIAAALDEALAIQPTVYAAFESPASYSLGGSYVALFEGDDPRVGQPGIKRGMAVAVTDGRVVALALACGAGDGASSLLPRDVSRFLLPPPFASGP